MTKGITVGMSQEMQDAIKWALENKKLIADVEAGVVINARSGKSGYILNTGYLQTSFYKDGKQYQPKTHQVIAVAGGLDCVGMTINHINGNKLDNRLCNLEAITNAENLYHAYKTGLNNSKGSKNPTAKLTESDVLQIKQLLSEGELTQTAIAEMFNVSRVTITEINTGKRWSHVSHTASNSNRTISTANTLVTEEATV